MRLRGGTEVPKRLIPTNLISVVLITELVEWDKFRYHMTQAGNEEFKTLDGFIEDGAFCYQRSLLVLHGQALHSSPRQISKWLKYSRKSRKKLAKKFGVIRGEKDLNLTEEDLAASTGSRPSAATAASWRRSRYGPSRTNSIAMVTWSQPTKRAGRRRLPKARAADANDPHGLSLADLERRYGGGS